MVMFLVTLALAPWLHPLAFRLLPGWQTGMSGDTHSLYVGPAAKRVPPPLESSAWIARNVRYRDSATDDPPNRTLAHLAPNGVIVWAVIYTPAQFGAKPIRLDLSKAKHFACCEGAYLASGNYELTGTDPRGGTYSVIVRIYFGSRPTDRLRDEGPRPAKWCTRLSASSSPDVYAASEMAITSWCVSAGSASAFASDSMLR